MRSSFSIFLLLKRIQVIKAWNAIIRLIRGIPWLGKKLGNQYRFHTVKRILQAGAIPFTILSRMLGSAIFSGIWIYAYANIVGSVSVWFFQNGKNPADPFALLSSGGWFLLYMIPFLGNSMLFSGLLEIKAWKNQLQIPVRDAGLVYAVWDPLVKYIARTMTWLILFRLLSPTWSVGQTLLGSTMLILSEWAAEWFWLPICIRYQRDEKKWLKNGISIFLFITLLSLGIAASVDQWRLLDGLLWMNLALAVPAYMGLKTVFRTVSMPVLLEKAREEEAVVQEAVKAVTGIKVQEEDPKLFRETKKKGYARLNELFFRRHRKKIMKPFLRKVLILFALLTALSVYLWIHRASLPQQEILEISVYMTPFVLYILLRNETITRAMYENCDRALLRYSFFKEPQAILSLFQERAKVLTKMTAMPISIVILFFLVNGFLYTGSFRSVVPNILTSFSWGVFFSTYALFQYYVFQPYDKDGKVRSFTVSVMNLLLYALCFFIFPPMAEYVPSRLFAWISFGGILLFAPIAFWCVYHFGPKALRRQR